MAELVAGRLTAFIADNNAKPWSPGSVDCCMVLADWAIWLGHPDPARHLRGTYGDEVGFRRIITDASGAVPIVERCVDHIRGARIAKPALGSIGVIGSHHNIDRQWGAIFDGQRWLVRFANGFAPMVARPLAIWKI
ncbi:DUF6950 family protein [Rhizobium sp. 768_B6_N1_8]|uniref:DUF6950 family protein n=1 Tax=unclassified Rhizobium TaxID=2613769 RepID=UPI003F28301E